MIKRLSGYCCAIALATMFGGIWVGDSQLLSYLPACTSVIGMRVISMAVYSLMVVVALVLSRRFPRPHDGYSHDVRMLRHERLLLFIGTIVGLVAYLLGIALIVNSANLAFVGFVLTKIIGAPLSIATVILAGRVERETATTMISVGSLGAFLIFIIIEYFMTDFTAALVCSVALLLFSVLSNYLGLTLSLPGAEQHFGIQDEQRDSAQNGQHLDTQDEQHLGMREGQRHGTQDERRRSAQDEQTVITRPLRKILTNGFIAGLLLASVALGFSRHTRSVLPGFSPLILALLLFLVIVVILVFSKVGHRTARPSPLFKAALICFSAGILLLAIAPNMLEGLSSTLNVIGSAFFETVVWLMMAWAVRNCSHQLLAGTVARFVVVAGHLLGTILVQLEFLSDGGLSPYPKMSALILILFYFALILLAIGSPALRSLLLEIPSGEMDSKANNPVEEGDEEESVDERYWTAPCKKVALSYGLTARETETLGLLARGRDISFMEETFVLSRNTIKMHIRHIYQKLDVHSKQEVIDMIESARSTLNDSCDGNA